MKTIEGVFPAIITPFTEDNEICLQTLESHLSFLADQGVHGFVPCGTTGESPTLSFEEWTLVVQTTHAFAKNKNLTTIAGCGGNDPKKALTFINQAKEIGCDAVLVVTPYYNKPNAAGTLAHFQYISKHSTLPIILYNVPSRTNVNIPPSMVAKLFEQDNIIAIKEASGDYAAWVEIAERCDLSKKGLLAGNDTDLAAIMALGGCGTISASANILPKMFVEIYNAAKSGQWDTAFKKQIEISPITRALFTETNPAPAKEALKLMKGYPSNLRLPLVNVSDQTRSLLERSLKDGGQL